MTFGTLTERLQDIDEQAKSIIQQTVDAMAQADGTDETMKAENTMRWVGLMNNYRYSAEEIISKN